MMCGPVVPASERDRAGRRRGQIASLALFALAFGCSSGTDGPTNPVQPPPETPAVPALESVPYALLGSGTVAFERIGPGGVYSAVYFIDADAASSTHAFDNVVTFGPALSPDGSRLAYTRTSSDITTLHDVYVARIDGTDTRQATNFPSQEGPPSWTPDGGRIVMTAGVHGSGVYDVYSQSPVSNPGDRTQHTHFAPAAGGALPCPIMADNDARVTVSSQGSLVFACGTAEIDVLSSTGTLLATYRPSHADRRRWPNVFSPAWSPDGTRIAFVETTSDSATNYGVVGVAVKVIDADGSNVTTLATHAGSNAPLGGGWVGLNDLSLCWMPDGSRLVFSIPESTLVGHLWVVRADGTGKAQLTSAPGVYDRSVSCAG